MSVEKPDPWDRTASSWPGVLSLCAVTCRTWLPTLDANRKGVTGADRDGEHNACGQGEARDDSARCSVCVGGEGGGDPLSGHRR